MIRARKVLAGLAIAATVLVAPAVAPASHHLIGSAQALVGNALYDKGRAAFLVGAINVSSDTIKAALVNTSTYTVNLSTDQYESSITSAIIGTPATLASITTTAGVFNAANVTYTSVTGAAAGAVVIFKDTGTAATSPLIAYIDTATGLPVTPNGGNITITWDTGANKIFKL